MNVDSNHINIYIITCFIVHTYSFQSIIHALSEILVYFMLLIRYAITYSLNFTVSKH